MGWEAASQPAARQPAASAPRHCAFATRPVACRESSLYLGMDSIMKAAEAAERSARDLTAAASAGAQGLASEAAGAARGTLGAYASNMPPILESPAKQKSSGSMDYFSSSKLFGQQVSETNEFDIEAPNGGGGDSGGMFGSFKGLGMGGSGDTGNGGSGPGAEDTDTGGWLSSASGLVRKGSGMVPIPFGKKEDEGALDISRTKRMKYFVILLIAAGFCFSMALTFLPILPIRPQKFALMFSLGSILAVRLTAC